MGADEKLLVLTVDPQDILNVRFLFAGRALQRYSRQGGSWQLDATLDLPDSDQILKVSGGIALVSRPFGVSFIDVSAASMQVVQDLEPDRPRFCSDLYAPWLLVLAFDSSRTQARMGDQTEKHIDVSSGLLRGAATL